MDPRNPCNRGVEEIRLTFLDCSTPEKYRKRFRTRSIRRVVEPFDARGWDIGQDKVPVPLTMGTTTALSRQAVINGAMIKPAKHEADGFRWLEG